MKFFRKVFASENLLLFEEKRQRFFGEILFAKRSQTALREFSGIPEGRFPFSEDSKGALFREKELLLFFLFMSFSLKPKKSGEADAFKKTFYCFSLRTEIKLFIKALES